MDLGDKLPDIIEFVHKKHATFTVLQDGNKIWDAWTLEIPPMNVVVDKSGRVAYAAVGYDEGPLQRAVAGAVRSAGVTVRRGTRKAAAGSAAPVRAATVPAAAAGTQSANRPFPDVPPDHWAFQAVETLRKVGVVNGYPGSASTQTGR